MADNIFVERLWRTVKYEDIYLKDDREVPDLLLGLSAYFEFYHHERRHPSLSYRTPATIYARGEGGGAKIIDQFGEGTGNSPASSPSPGEPSGPLGNGAAPSRCMSADIA